MKITAPFYISQNDGTLMNADFATDYPVLTFASGPTNSMRGAAFLSGLKDAIVIDVGGTTTDVGVLQHGFPRVAALAVSIGGVRTNFRMPDTLSIGLGGGSLVQTEPLPRRPAERRLRDHHEGARLRRRRPDDHRRLRGGRRRGDRRRGPRGRTRPGAGERPWRTASRR